MVNRHGSRKNGPESRGAAVRKRRYAALSGFDNACHEEGFLQIAGVDEAGRGALAGPVVAAAVILSTDFGLDGVDDSKRLSEKVREGIFDVVIRQSLAVAIAFGQPRVIDRENILRVTLMAMHRAVDALRVRPDLVLIDGRDEIHWCGPQRAVTGGDGKSLSIASASIVAKVARDRAMRRLGRAYPGYGLSRNKGYGTVAHIAAIEASGPAPVHRRTFLTKIIEKNAAMF